MPGYRIAGEGGARSTVCAAGSARGDHRGLLATGCATVDRNDLSNYVSELHSQAAEGALVAGQAAQRRAPAIFVWIESAELHHQAQYIEEEIGGEMDGPSLRSSVPKIELLAESVMQALQFLHEHSDQPADARRVEAVLARGAEQAKRLQHAVQ